jgi:CD109 antigen
LFLLRNTDRFGVWHSTQATVNVLDALMTVVGGSQQSAGATSAEVVVNGRTVASIEVPGSDQPVNPILVDLSRFLMPTGNAVEIRGRPNGAASVQFVESYYIPWTQSQDSSSPLRFAVTYDKTEAKVGDEIHCRVEAERVGFRGYGMILAEIGLPPGADVDRASLEAAIKSRNWDVNRYEVLPDRIILYLWPRAGGTRFDFTFRVRYGINAQTPASTVYDYYNPDAQVTVKPARFVIEAN